ncbi:MAG: hypothetical protein LIP09_13055 [Bacteroidales bacterium]|nr:hypothetical protein [Bacteroidales bacterium]
MKKAIYILFTLVFILTACSKKQPDDQPQSLMEASRLELVNALEERDQLLAMVKEIATTMDQIKQLENIVTLSGVRTIENSSQRNQVVADILELQKVLKQRHEQLAELEEKMKQSNCYNDELTDIISMLKFQLDSQSKEIENLKHQLAIATEQIKGLSHTVDSLTLTVFETNLNLDSVQAASEQLENELNACYYVVATKDELKDHKIIEKSFLKKTKLLKGDFDQDFFITSDKRVLQALTLRSNKAKLYTQHPDGSYEILKTEGHKKLVILDPEKFWSLSNYLVIQID